MFSDLHVELHSEDVHDDVEDGGDDDDDIDDDVDDGYICRPQISHLDVLQPLGEDQLLVDCHSQQLQIHIVVYHDENGCYDEM